MDTTHYGSIERSSAESGTQENPIIVEFTKDNSTNPLDMSFRRKIYITSVIAISSLCASLSSSAYMSGADAMMKDFGVSIESITIGLSVFVLGHAIGPLIWGPLSELQGRRFVFVISYAFLALSNIAVAMSNSLVSLVIARLAAGMFAASPLTNAGAIIADIWPKSQRGLAMSAFVLSPYLGPAIGPMIGGAIVFRRGWRFLHIILGIFSGLACLVGILSLPETYGPVILRRQAAKLSKISGKIYCIVSDRNGTVPASIIFRNAASRPWIFLLYQPVVTIVALWTAIIYGTLYSFFNAFPFVYKKRGWGTEYVGIAFSGLAIGMVFGVIASIQVNKKYKLNLASGDKRPERRLDAARFASLAIPFALFWFACTNGPNVPAVISIASGVPFGYGMVLVYLAVSNFLIDIYGVYAASALAANTLIRSLFGAVFPLIVPKLYGKLGVHWAAAIPAILSLVCAPLPWALQTYSAFFRGERGILVEAGSN